MASAARFMCAAGCGRWGVLALVAMIGAVLTGCGSVGRGVLRIHDMETRQDMTVPPTSFREAVRIEVSPVRAFYTMTREGDGLVIRKRDHNGTELRRMGLPLLTMGYVGSGWSAINPSGMQLVYHDRETRKLRLWNLKAGTSRPIASPVIDSVVSIQMMTWVNEEDLMLTVYKGVGKTTLYRIGVRSGSIRRRETAFDLYPFPRISPNRRLVCGVVDHLGENAQVVIMDTGTMRETARISMVRPGQPAGGMGWTADSMRLLFLEGLGEDQQLYVYDVKRRSTTAGPALPERSLIIEGSAGETVAFRGTADGRSHPVRVLDLRTGTWTTCGPQNGSIHGIPGTRRYVISE